MRILATLLLLTTPLLSQATFAPFGAGCTFENQVPAIGNVGLPQIGQTFAITYTGPNYTYSSAQQIAQPYLALGLQASAIAIPPNLLIYQPTGCTGLLDPIALIPMPADPVLPVYANSYDVGIPNDPTLVGFTFFAQWLLIHQQCGIAGCGLSALVTSDAATVQVGL